MLNWQPEIHAVGVAEMDGTHEEFLRKVAVLTHAGDDDFPLLFHDLALHLRAHFEGESRLMRACAFPALVEHESEHRRLLGDVALIGRSVAAGRLGLARAFVAVGLGDWFRTHLATMDSALGARLKGRPAAVPDGNTPR
jgi:hemerythrin